MSAVDNVFPVFATLTYLSFASLFLCLAIIDRSRAFALFSLALVLSVVSGLFEGLSQNASNVFFEGACITALAATYAMAKGSYVLLFRAVPKQLIAYAATGYAAHVIIQHFNTPFYVSHFPITLAIFAYYAHTAANFWRFRSAQKFFQYLTSMSAAIAGLFQFAYPFVRTADSAWPFAIGLLLTQIMLISFTITYFVIKTNLASTARATLEAYINDSPIGILVTNKDGLIIKANIAFERMIGLSEASLQQTSLARIVSMESFAQLDSFLDKSHKGRANREILFLNRENDRIPCRVTIGRQDDGNNILFCDNLSDDKVAEREKAELQQLVFQSSQMASLGELAASVAHEINTPLAIVKASAETCKNSLSSLQSGGRIFETNISRIQMGAQRIESIAKSLLGLSRKNETAESEVDLRECIKDTLQFMSILLSKNQIKVTLELGNYPLFVRVCEGEINQILTNLITNARDALEKTARKSITIRCTHENGLALLSVEDTGIGMLPQVASRAFEQFYSTKASNHGTGLGLPLSRKMAQKNGGSLTFQTAPGEGTVFTLSLPLLSVPATSNLHQESQSNSLESRKRVLLVDDEPAILEILEEHLTAEGYHITCASTLADAQKQIETNTFDYVFTDYVLDYGTGEDIIKSCRKRFSRNTCRVFLLSGYAKNETIKADGHIKKPFSLTDVSNAIRDS